MRVSSGQMYRTNKRNLHFRRAIPQRKVCTMFMNSVRSNIYTNVVRTNVLLYLYYIFRYLHS